MNYTRYSTQAALTDSDVIDMRVLASSSEEITAAEIGDMYGIDPTTARRIINGRTWTHVPQPKQIGNYSVYPDGRIYSRAAGRFMQPQTGKDGQQYVELRSGGSRQKVSVALLVARAFINKNAKTVNFINGNAEDVHFTNLQARR
jgi:hypothetical protein